MTSDELFLVRWRSGLVMALVTLCWGLAASMSVAEENGLERTGENENAEEKAKAEIASIEVDPSSVLEGERQTVAIIATLDRESESRLRLPLVVATNDTSYRVWGRRSIVFAVGSRSATTRVTVWATDDTAHEETELIEVAVGSGDAVATSFIEIKDDDRPPEEAMLTAEAMESSVKLSVALNGETTFGSDTDIIVKLGELALAQRIRIDARKTMGSITVDSEQIEDILVRQVNAIASDGGDASAVAFRAEAVERALSVTTVGDVWDSIVRDAVERWGETQRSTAESTNMGDVDREHSYGEYLRKSYNIVRVVGDMDSDVLNRVRIAEYLDVGEVNRRQAIARDTAAFNAAKGKDTAESLEAYLQRFPEGKYTMEAQELRDALNLACVKPKVKFRDCATCPEMVVVGAGTYTMGGDTSDDWSETDEYPSHTVTIARPFAVGIYEVKEREYAHQLPGGRAGCWQPEGTAGEGDTWRRRAWPASADEERAGNKPVVCVNWHDAIDYVEELRHETGEEYRLLSEAEWEYVARAGGVGRRFAFGERLNNEIANYRMGDGSTVGANDVGAYEDNDWGLYDLHGNVWEWVRDNWKEDYNGVPSDGSAYDDGGELRVMRGGSWADEERYSRSAMRGRAFAETRTSFTGFRVAREVDRCPIGGALRLVSAEEVREDGTGSSIVVSAEVNSAPIEDLSVMLSFAGTAENGDYTATISHPAILIRAEETVGSATVTIVPVDDDFYEGEETVEVRGAADGLRLISTDVIVKDDEDGVKLSVSPQEIEEGAGPVRVVVIATDSKGSRGDLKVNLEFGGTAVMGVDYVVTPEDPAIEILEDQGEGSVTLTIEGLADNVAEGAAETIVVRERTLDLGEMARAIGATITLKDSR